MRGGPAKSIRTLIFRRFFVTAILLVVVVGGLGFFLTRQTLQNYFREDNARTLQFISNNVQSHFQSDLHSLDQLAQRLPMTQASTRQSLVAQFLSFPSIFSSVHLYAKDGQLLLHERRADTPSYRPESNFHDNWDRNFIEQAEAVLRDGNPRLTEIFRNTQGRNYQLYLVPLKGSKAEVLGLLSGAFFYDDQAVSHMLKGLKMGSNNFIFLSDLQGRSLLFDGLPSEEWSALLSPDLQQIAHSLYGGDINANLSGVEINHYQFQAKTYLLFSSAIRPMNLTLTLGVSETDIQQRMAFLLKAFFAVLVAALLLTLLASVLLGKQLAEGFRLIATALQKISDGDFTHRLNDQQGDEFGEVCHTINSLSERIDKARYLGNLWNEHTEYKQ